MNKIYLVTFSALFLMACGGGSSEPQGNSSTEHTKHLGTWESNCDAYLDGTSEDTLLDFRVDDGIDTLTITTFDYATSDCSGIPTNVLILAGSPLYSGETTTSNCIADNIDLEIVAGSVDLADPVTGNALATLLQQNDIPSTHYDIVCQFNNSLFLGDETAILDGSSSAKRPVVEDISLVFSRTAGRGLNINDVSAARALHGTNLPELMGKYSITLDASSSAKRPVVETLNGTVRKQ